jgi:hypothetical protein
MASDFSLIPFFRPALLKWKSKCNWLTFTVYTYICTCTYTYVHTYVHHVGPDIKGVE